MKLKPPSPGDLGDRIRETEVWKSIFRVGIPNTNRKRVLAVLGSLILHLHPVKVRRSGVRMSYTWCMGGTSFFLFLVVAAAGPDVDAAPPLTQAQPVESGHQRAPVDVVAQAQFDHRL